MNLGPRGLLTDAVLKDMANINDIVIADGVGTRKGNFERIDTSIVGISSVI